MIESTLLRTLLALCSAMPLIFAEITGSVGVQQPNHATSVHDTKVHHAASVLASSTAGTRKVLPDELRYHEIVLHRNAGSDRIVQVSVGIPLPPGVLNDTHLVRVLDENGTEIPSAVQATLRWHFKDGSLRAIRAQFRAELSSDERTFYFAVGKPRTRDIGGWPYIAGLVVDAHGLQVPAVVATLDPQWLSESLVAGPQQPADAKEAYANYVATQFKWARELPVSPAAAWLFDRPTALYKAYIRTGRFDYLQAAILSYHFYMKYIRREGFSMSPWCAGGWAYEKVNPCDVKYVYIEPILLALALTGDDSEHDTALVDRMMNVWESGGWNNRPGPYTQPSQGFTERLAGLGLLETVSAYELTGEARYRSQINDRLGWLRDHQHNNPDRLGDDGSWRNSWNVHEGDSWNADTDVRGTSPWMTENIIDGLWHAWLVTGDKRIPEMITGFGHYLERFGWIDAKVLVRPHDWRDSCSGADGQIAWYWSSAHTTMQKLIEIQDSEGWYSDAHNVELALPVAAAYYFESDPVQRAALKRRLDALASSYNTACASNSSTPRRFNWNNRGSGVVQWLIRQPGGAGALRNESNHLAR